MKEWRLAKYYPLPESSYASVMRLRTYVSWLRLTFLQVEDEMFPLSEMNDAAFIFCDFLSNFVVRVVLLVCVNASFVCQ
jgi:hypothetical protein